MADDNLSFDEPIRTHEQARRFFQAMGCSAFHMAREYPQRYEDYRRLEIGKDLEVQWIVEEIRIQNEQLNSGEGGTRDLWAIHSTLTDLVVVHRLDRFLEDILKSTVVLEQLPSISQKDRLLLAETIVGRGSTPRRSGLIFRSHDFGRAELAVSFAMLARRLVAAEFLTATLETRRQNLLSELAESEQELAR